MDSQKIGKLIKTLRKEKQLTQMQLAEHMNISDKTISKWERGLGCPDISFFPKLSGVFDVDLEKLLSGRLDVNEVLGGNMKHTKFYYLCRAAYRRRHDDTETISGMGSAGADSGLRAWEAAMVLQQARSVLSERLMAGMYSGKLIFFLLLKS